MEHETWIAIDRVALNDFELLETCLVEIEYNLSLSLDGVMCPG